MDVIRLCNGCFYILFHLFDDLFSTQVIVIVWFVVTPESYSSMSWHEISCKSGNQRQRIAAAQRDLSRIQVSGE